jgi:alkylhydroperoxidase family enzyme
MSDLPRIAPLAPPYLPAVAEDLEKLMPPGMAPLGLFRTVAHNPRVLRRLRRGGLLDPGAITLRERELVILRTTARCGSEYEWGVHVTFFAAAAGFTAAQLAATVEGPADDPVWSPRERLLLALCDALHDQARVPDPLWSALAEELDAAQLIELLALAGQYHMISFLTNAARIEPEPGAARYCTSASERQLMSSRSGSA